MVGRISWKNLTVPLYRNGVRCSKASLLTLSSTKVFKKSGDIMLAVKPISQFR